MLWDLAVSRVEWMLTNPLNCLLQVHVPGNRVVDAVCGWWHTLFLSLL